MDNIIKMMVSALVYYVMEEKCGTLGRLASRDEYWYHNVLFYEHTRMLNMFTSVIKRATRYIHLCGAWLQWTENRDEHISTCADSEKSSELTLAVPDFESEVAPTRFPLMQFYLDSPRWLSVRIEDLSAKEVSTAYARAIPDVLPPKERLWALDQSYLFEIVEPAGGWQSYFLSSFDVDYPLSNQSVMDVLLSNQTSPLVQRYWRSLVKEAPFPLSADLDSEGIAEDHPIVWARHTQGLLCIQAVFARFYQAASNEKS